MLSISIIILISCAPEEPGDTGEPPQAVTFTVNTVTNGRPIGGVNLTYEGISIQTNSAGSLVLTFDPAEYTEGTLPETVTITASKKFFVTSSTTFTLSDYTESSTLAEDIEIAPRIFIPDMMGNLGVGRIVAIDDMSGTNRVDLSEIPGYIDSIAENNEIEAKLGKLDAPTAINVDYDNGIIYIFDVESSGNAAGPSNAAFLIRLTDFPTSTSDTLAAADVKIFGPLYISFKSRAAAPSLTAIHQAVITGVDELLTISGNTYSSVELHKLSGMSTGTITVTEAAADTANNLPTSLAPGLTVLPNGKLLLLHDSIGGANEEFLVLDNFADTDTSDFMTNSSPSPGDVDYFALAFRLLVDLDGRWLYTGDVYNSNWHQEGTEMDRIARFNLSSTAANLDRTNYGSEGSGTAQFNEPVLLAVLPDNRLYIQDAANSRLIRIDWTGSGTASGYSAYKPENNAGTADIDESFGFEYFYNAC